MGDHKWEDFFSSDEERFRNQPAPFKFECPMALKFGKLRTRCKKQLSGHGPLHEGRGLEQFPYQTVEWNRGHSDEYEVDPNEVNWERDRFYAWEAEE